MREREGLYSTVGWIHELEIGENPVFWTREKVRFAKLNLIFGANCTGKTSLVEWIAGSIRAEYLDRWTPPQGCGLSFRLSILNPDVTRIDTLVSSEGIRTFRINETCAPFVPITFQIFDPGPIWFHDKADHLGLIARMLGLTPDSVLALVREIEAFPHATVKNIRFECEGDRRILRADVDGTAPDLLLEMLSGREVERVLMEFVTAAARFSGRYVPTLLILDGTLTTLFEGIFDFYSHHLLDPENPFQTIICIPSQDLDLDAIRWRGWEVIRTYGKAPEVRLHQELRAVNPA